MSKIDIDHVCNTLFAAHLRKSQLAPPIERSAVHGVSQEAAYAIQERLCTRLAAERSDPMVGFKISMTSTDSQAILGASEPAYGRLFKSSILYSPGRVEVANLNAPLFEAELQIILEDDIPVGAPIDEIQEKCSLSAGIELPDCRYQGDWFKQLNQNLFLPDVIVDNDVVGLVVMSPERVAAKGLDMTRIEMTATLDGKPLATGRSDSVLGNPLHAIRWLNGKVREHGGALKSGMVISSGTFLLPLLPDKGHYRVSYEGVGTVELALV